MQSLTPFLWFDGKVAEAVAFYRSVFPDTVVVETRGRGPDGGMRAATLTLLGQTLMLFDGGPHYALTPALSLFVRCDTQAEIDRAWDGLVAGGTPLRCGWLTDRFGLTWQVVPTALAAMLQDPDPDRAGRVLRAMMGMVRLDLAALEAAYDAR